MKGRAGRFELVQKISDNKKYAINVSIDTKLQKLFTKMDFVEINRRGEPGGFWIEREDHCVATEATRKGEFFIIDNNISIW